MKFNKRVHDFWRDGTIVLLVEIIGMTLLWEIVQVQNSFAGVHGERKN